MKQEKINYAQAIEEVEAILETIEHEEIDVDDLLAKVQRVSYLLDICRKKLTATESEVEKILEDIKNQ